MRTRAQLHIRVNAHTHTHTHTRGTHVHTLFLPEVTGVASIVDRDTVYVCVAVALRVRVTE